MDSMPKVNSRMTPWLALAGLLTLSLGLYGCAAVVASGVVAGAAGGISYTYDSIAYKTFAVPLDPTFRATMKALEKMDMKVAGSKDMVNGKEIVAHTVDLRIEIGIERLTDRATKVSVNAKKGVFLKDKATATEILIQVGKFLGEA